MGNGQISKQLDESLDKLLKAYTGYLDPTPLKGELIHLFKSVDQNAEARGRAIVGNALDEFVQKVRAMIRVTRKRDIIDRVDFIASLHKNEILPE